MDSQIKFVSALTQESDVAQAGQSLITDIEAGLGGLPIDLLLVFISPHFRATAAELSETLQNRLGPRIMLGNTAEGVIGKTREIEQAPAIAAIAAHLPEVRLTPFVLQSMNWETLLNDGEAFTSTVGAPDDTRLLLLLADPFTTPIDMVLTSFNQFYPDLPVMGGLASGSTRPGGNILYLNQQVNNNGAVGVALAGEIDVDVIVSQGCRPIGEPLAVTSAEKNMIFTLAGEAPLAYLQRLVNQLPETDQNLLQNGLFIGRTVAPEHEVLGRGDFLVRGVMGIDRRNGAMVVGDHIEADEIIQFHVRDAGTATEDLEMMLAPQLLYDSPSGGLLFSCNGRGTRLYPHPDGDISTIQKVIGNVDVSGFFCAGEIGPIGGKNFLHGHTASLVLFRAGQTLPPLTPIE